MRRTRYRELGAVAIGVLVLASFFVAGLSPGLANAAAPTSGSSHPAVAVSTGSASPRPLASPTGAGVIHPANVTNGVNITSTIGTFTYLPTTVETQISISGDNVTLTNLSVANTTLVTYIYDANTGALCTTINAEIAPDQAVYGFLLNPQLLQRTACPGITTDPVELLTVFTFTGYPYAGNASASAAAVTSLIFAPLSGRLLTPVGSVGIGNTTFVAQYAAQYVFNATLTLWAPGKTSIVDTANLTWSTTTTPAYSTWYAATTGVYPYAFTIMTAYGNYTTTGNITVIASGTPGVVFYNSSVYHNSTILGGLTGATAGTLLLVVGLVIGMIVALAVASAMRRSAPPTAQPWQQGQGQQSAAAPNTCSVCGKSFGSADELAAHMKSEHGMS